jgi:hypothetical protein
MKSRAERPKAVSRTPRWAKALALAVEIRFGKKGAATSEPARTEEEDRHEPMLQMEEGDLLAAYRATGDVGINVEDAAGDRVIKPWQDLEAFTLQDVARMEYWFKIADIPGNVRALEAAEDQAKLLRRIEFEALYKAPKGYPQPSIEMQKLAILARNLRGASCEC